MRECVSCQGSRIVVDAYAQQSRPCSMCEKAAYEAWCEDMRPATARLAVLDEKGRCCGRKPIRYSSHLFCPRCNAAFTHEGKQQPNWAWMERDGVFVAKTPSAELARRNGGGR